MPSRFIVYRIESILMYIVFVGAFATAIQTGNVAWFVLGGILSGIGTFHLSRLKCPKCGDLIMRRRFKYFYLQRLNIPKKCDTCGSDLSKM